MDWSSHSPSFGRRAYLGGLSGGVVGGLSGCLEWIAEAGRRDDTPIRTVAVESDRDGEFYYPTPENIESGVYSPLTRPLYIYVNHGRLEAQPDLLGSFLKFYFEGQQAFARETGYFATDDHVVEANLDTLTELSEQLGIDPSADELVGEISCSGSNTVAPVTSAAGQDFTEKHSEVLVAVEPEGTGAGFATFAMGDSDLQSASRTISPEEAALAEEHGVEYTAFEIGWDGLSVVVHEENTWMTEITLEELAAIWRFGSTVTHWNQVRSSYPDRAMELWGRDPASGTFDFFTETIGERVGDIRYEYSPHTDTGSVMEGVGTNRFAMGWGGVGYFIELAGHPGEQ